MLIHPTMPLLAELGLHGKARSFQELQAQPESRALEHADWLALLLERESTMRRQKRFENRARAAARPRSRALPQPRRRRLEAQGRLKSTRHE